MRVCNRMDPGGADHPSSYLNERCAIVIHESMGPVPNGRWIRMPSLASPPGARDARNHAAVFANHAASKFRVIFRSADAGGPGSGAASPTSARQTRAVRP